MRLVWRVLPRGEHGHRGVRHGGRRGCHLLHRFSPAPGSSRVPLMPHGPAANRINARGEARSAPNPGTAGSRLGAVPGTLPSARRGARRAGPGGRAPTVVAWDPPRRARCTGPGPTTCSSWRSTRVAGCRWRSARCSCSTPRAACLPTPCRPCCSPGRQWSRGCSSGCGRLRHWAAGRSGWMPGALRSRGAWTPWRCPRPRRRSGTRMPCRHHPPRVWSGRCSTPRPTWC